ncbi:aromatic-ring-hydroxylating dioxygenase subunit beta [Sphingomonas sp. ID0503]|uniref:aromatic-ring-hydroxylating dioxygenase subunit beta n=1 Tax=Sphingomonas sp. ID0503 TaxID=3399691 RepID=UPI003AFAFFB5
MSAPDVTAAMILQHRVEALLFHEADLLDRWQLTEWEALFTDDAEYLVPPMDVDGDTASPDTSLFYVFDDRTRLHERVVRLKNKGAHSEWPRSRTRRLISNVIARPEGDLVSVRASFVVYRSKDGVTDSYIGHYLYLLTDDGADLRIARKTCVLDLEALRPHGRISIIL